MPMPAPQVSERQPNSLWRSGSRAFFKDQRASRVGDIMTVTIQINDEARINNQTTRTRSSTENLGLPGLFGFQRNIARILPTPDTDTLENLGQTNSDSESTGRGQIQRTDSVRLRVAAIITQVLPNGNFAIEGRQEVRVNFELRDLQIRGVIRPEDIDNQNTIPYDKIAEARIAYGGRGQITDVQQPRWGQQVYDIIAPF
jgi:flagellar L-ring protein precursor FlgH